MKKKENLILGLVILYDWDNLCDPYVYDQHEILEDALSFFPNASSKRNDIREERIKIMETTPTSNEQIREMIIQKERKKSEFEGPLLDCWFSFDNTIWIRGIFWRHAIRFFSEGEDEVSENIKNILIDFIKLHTPLEFHGEIHLGRKNIENA